MTSRQNHIRINQEKIIERQKTINSQEFQANLHSSNFSKYIIEDMQSRSLSSKFIPQSQQTQNTLDESEETYLGVQYQTGTGGMQNQEVKKKKKHKKKKKDSITIQTNPHQNQILEKNKIIQSLEPKVIKRQIHQVKKNLFPSDSSKDNKVSSLAQSLNFEPEKNNPKPDNLNDNEVKAISNIFGQFFKVQNLKSFQKQSTKGEVKRYPLKIVGAKNDLSQNSLIESKKQSQKLIQKSVFASKQVEQSEIKNRKGSTSSCYVKISCQSQIQKQQTSNKKPQFSCKSEFNVNLHKSEHNANLYHKISDKQQIQSKKILKQSKDSNLQSLVYNQKPIYNQFRFSQIKLNKLQPSQIQTLIQEYDNMVQRQQQTANYNIFSPLALNSIINQQPGHQIKQKQIISLLFIPETINEEPLFATSQQYLALLRQSQQQLSQNRNNYHSQKQASQQKVQTNYLQPQFTYLNKQLTETPLIQEQQAQNVQDQPYSRHLAINQTHSYYISSNQEPSIVQRQNISQFKAKCNNLKVNFKDGNINSANQFEQREQTPFFKLKKTDSHKELSENTRNINLKKNEVNNIYNRSYSGQLQNNKNASGKKKPSQFSVKAQSEIISDQSNSMSVILSNTARTNTFLPIQSQILHINHIFKEFDIENRLPIDNLSYNSNFETFQTISSNLINQMQKDEQNKYIQELSQKQKQWRSILIKDILSNLSNNLCNGSNVSSVLNISPLKNDFQTDNNNENNIQYQVRQPQPTLSNSPTKNSFLQAQQLIHLSKNYQNQNLKSSYTIATTRPLIQLNLAKCSIYPSLQDQIKSSSQNNQQANQNYIKNSHLHKSSQKKINPQKLQPTPNNIEILDELQKQEKISTIQQYYHDLQQKESAYKINQNNDLNEQQDLLSPIVESKHEYSISGSYEDNKRFFDSSSNSVLNKIHNIHEIKQKTKPVVSFIYHSPKQNILKLDWNKSEALSVNASQIIQQQHQKAPDCGDDKYINCNIPTHNIKIQPIKVTSVNHSNQKNFDDHINISEKSNKKKPVSSKKMKLTMNNPSQKVQKTVATNSIMIPPQMNAFLFNSSHIGSFMLNTVIKNYTQTHPIVENSENFIKNTEQKFACQAKGNNPPTHESINLSSNKKKVTIKKGDNKGAKKLSINQNLKTLLFNTKNQKNSSRNSKLDQAKDKKPQTQEKLKQQVLRINCNKSRQIMDLVKSRITQRSRSQGSSVYNSPHHNTFRLQQDEAPINFGQHHSILAPKHINSNQIYRSRKARITSNSKQNSINKSQKSSTPNKKQGIQLWNEGLSELKSSRKSNRNSSSKIFSDKQKRQGQKIIGLTRWNQNLSKFKQSRNKSRQSRKSSNSHTKQNQQRNFADNAGIQQKKSSRSMNIEIKRHKYQLENVQKRYL